MMHETQSNLLLDPLNIIPLSSHHIDRQLLPYHSSCFFLSPHYAYCMHADPTRKASEQWALCLPVQSA